MVIDTYCTQSLISYLIQLITSSPTSCPHPDSDLAPDLALETGLALDPEAVHPSKSSLVHPYCHPYAPVHAPVHAPELALVPDLAHDLAATRKTADHTQSIHHRKCYQASNSSEVAHSMEETVYPASHIEAALVEAVEMAVDAAAAAVAADIALSNPLALLQVAAVAVADVDVADAAEADTVAREELAVVAAAAAAAVTAV